MDTAMQEIIYQGLAVVISGIITTAGGYAIAYIKSKTDKLNYEFDNSRLERILHNAVDYAENYSKSVAKTVAVKIDGSMKQSMAKEYINKIDPTLVTKYGSELETMIDRKAAQVTKAYEGSL